MITYKNFTEKSELLKNGSISLTENVQNFLNEIEANKDINAFNFVFEDCIDIAKMLKKKLITVQPESLPEW